MSSYYLHHLSHVNGHHQHPGVAATSTPAHGHHPNRSRRAPRLSISHPTLRQFRGVRSMKELTEAANLSAFRTKFEACRSFDLDDDLEFCPGLLTESDLVSIHSSSSERSSLASNSPDSSPTQQPSTLATHFSLPSASPPYSRPTFHAQPPLKLHQPAATRARNAIPIVNPVSRMTMASPLHSVSPGRIPQLPIGRRW